MTVSVLIGNQVGNATGDVQRLFFCKPGTRRHFRISSTYRLMSVLFFARSRCIALTGLWPSFFPAEIFQHLSSGPFGSLRMLAIWYLALVMESKSPHCQIDAWVTTIHQPSPRYAATHHPPFHIIAPCHSGLTIIGATATLSFVRRISSSAKQFR